jgi:glucose/mannose-6-phosphate isomerase
MIEDLKKISEIDKSNMHDTIIQFPNQIKEAIEITKTAKINTVMKVDNILITGMGGSGISGDIVSRFFRNKIDIPIVVNKEYDLPKWAKKDTLTLFFSYSGNTEETISAFKIAYQKKCNIITISSGGRLQELSEKRGVPHIVIPFGFQPRAAVGYSIFISIMVLKRIGLITSNIEADIKECIAITENTIKNNNKLIAEENNLSKQIAKRILNTIPQIYGWGLYSPIATRWRQQLNENSKIIAREDILPESNHNDVVGWSFNPEVSKYFSCILFRDKDNESLHMRTRLNFIKKLFKDSTSNIIEIYPKGKSRLAKMIYIMYLGDFVSYYLAILRKIDPTPVDIIKVLKQRLAEI